MPNVTEAALKERARTLLVAMTERCHWVYALPRPTDPDDANDSWLIANGILTEAGVPRVAADENDVVRKFASDERQLNFILFDNEALGVVFLEGSGEGVVPLMARILERTSFIPQSKLWGEALNIRSEHALTALNILSHMAVVWDDDWTDLFLLYLAAPDAIVRHDATLALLISAMVARDVEPALELLREALKREPYPKLSETMKDVAGALLAYSGAPVDLQALAEQAGQHSPNTFGHDEPA